MSASRSVWESGLTRTRTSRYHPLRVKLAQAQFDTAIRSAHAAKAKNDVACECARLLDVEEATHSPPFSPRARCSRAATKLWTARAKTFRDNRDRAQAMLLKVEQMQQTIHNSMDMVGQAQLMAQGTAFMKANVAAMDVDKMQEVADDWEEGVSSLNDILEIQAAPLMTPAHMNAEEIDLDAEMANLGPAMGAAAPAAAARAPAAAAPPSAYSMPALPTVPSGRVAPRAEASSSMMDDLEALENA